jgi:hypothetical protein
MCLFSEFSFDKYIKDTFNLDTGDILSDYQRKTLMDGLGITEFLMDTQCGAQKLLCCLLQNKTFKFLNIL